MNKKNLLKILAAVTLALACAPLTAHAGTTWLVKLGYDAVKAEAGLESLTRVSVLARSRGLPMAQLLEVEPALATDAGVRELMKAARAGDVNFGFDGLRVNRGLQQVLCTGPTCAIGSLSATVDAAAARAAGEVVQGVVKTNAGIGVTVGDVAIPSGPLSNLLAKFPNAQAAVRGAHTTKGPAAFVPWTDQVWVEGRLVRLPQMEGSATHQLLIDGRSVPVTADMRLDAKWGGKSWFQLTSEDGGRTIRATPVGS